MDTILYKGFLFFFRFYRENVKEIENVFLVIVSDWIVEANYLFWIEVVGRGRGNVFSLVFVYIRVVNKVNVIFFIK